MFSQSSSKQSFVCPPGKRKRTYRVVITALQLFFPEKKVNLGKASNSQVGQVKQQPGQN